jgi:hypothetical protein
MYVEMTTALGSVVVIPLAAYLALPPEALFLTRARLLTRVEVLRHKWQANEARRCVIGGGRL